MKRSSVVDSLFKWVSKYRNQLMTALLSFNWIVAIALLFASYATATQNAFAPSFYALSKTSGDFAVVLFILVSMPGIARRFRFSNPLVMIISMFRRQLGVLMYLFVLIHAMVLRIIPWITSQIPMTPEVFVFAGTLSNIFLFAMFITSNDWSVKKLGDWWGKIHRMLYIIVWFIFMHLALLGIGKWTILIGITSILQLASHIYAKQRLMNGN